MPRVVAMSPSRTDRGSLRSAMTRSTRSRSVINPTNRSSSVIGRTPMSLADMRPAASPAFMSGDAVTGRSAIACRTSITDLGLLVLLGGDISSVPRLPSSQTRFPGFVAG
jgi:hypothetical protein